MCGDEFLKGKAWRAGYVKPLGRPWKEVQYADVDGRAVFEGCIILGDTAEMEGSRVEMEKRLKVLPELLTQPNAQVQGVAIRGRQFRWPNRTIPYEIDPALPQPQRVLDAMKHWQDRTTVRFRPHAGEPDFVFIRRVPSGCASAVGRRGGKQEIVVADICSTGNLIHELGHTIGLWHEQSRQDRPKHVRIRLENVDPDMVHNFDQHILDGEDLGAYDFGSIMHYPARAFSVDGSSPTIEPLQPLPSGVTMGQRVAASAGDIAAIEALYAKEPMPHA